MRLLRRLVSFLFFLKSIVVYDRQGSAAEGKQKPRIGSSGRPALLLSFRKRRFLLTS